MNAWVMAVRPRTLSMAVAPVLVGLALAWRDGHGLDGVTALLTVLAAMLIQAATNLHNDAADFLRGGDGPDRLGPPRACAMGLLPPGRVMAAALGCFALAGLAGLGLVIKGGWPILAVGAASLLAGWGYSAGKRPISHLPVGEVFVLAFFGVAAVMGTAWLQGHGADRAGLLAGLAVGGFASAVLLLNNHRDAVADARNGRHTLAILLGERGCHLVYGLFLLAPFAVLPILPGQSGFAFVILPEAVWLAWHFSRQERGSGLNRLLGLTALLQLGFGFFLALGLVL